MRSIENFAASLITDLDVTKGVELRVNLTHQLH